MARKETTGRMNSYDARFAAMAARSSSLEDSRVQGGNNVTFRAGQMSYNGRPVQGNKMEIIVLADVEVNAYYPGKFDPKNPSSPTCYAVGEKQKEMRPSEHCEEAEHTDCHSCPLNKFGSADTGGGKACKNGRRIAFYPADALDDLEGAEVAYAMIPPTSLKFFGTYQKTINDTFKKPLAVFITEMYVEPDDDHQFHVKFANIEEVKDSKLVGPLLDKADAELESLLNYQFPENSERPEPEKKGRVRGRQQEEERPRRGARAEREEAPTRRGRTVVKEEETPRGRQRRTFKDDKNEEPAPRSRGRRQEAEPEPPKKRQKFS